VLRRAGVRISPETLGLLRFGRAVDNRRLKATGYRYRYTSREAVLKLREHQRLSAIVGANQEAYRYERDVEEFLRRSPRVRPADRREATTLANLAPGQRRDPEKGPDSGAFEDLGAGELIALLPSLEPVALAELAVHEREHAARPDVLSAIERLQGFEADR
jgi:UDP-glucose 4-epimerase